MSKALGATAHSLRVTRLYRHGLKNLMNWCVWRDLWIEKGFELRAEFDANKAVTDPRKVEALLQAGEARLKEYTHPDPYTSACSPTAPTAPRGKCSFFASPSFAHAPCPCAVCALQSHTCRAAANTCATRSTARASRPRCAPPHPPTHAGRMTTRPSSLSRSHRLSDLGSASPRVRAGRLPASQATSSESGAQNTRLNIRGAARGRCQCMLE